MSVFLPYRLNNFYHRQLGYDIHNNSDRAGITLSLCKKVTDALINEGGRLNKIVSFDVGTGKSLFIISLIRFLKLQGQLTSAGIVIFLSRVEEIRAFISRTELQDHEFAVYSGNESLNNLGLGELYANDTPVLFVTQQKLKADREKKCVDFADMSHLFYKGKPRNLRLWDERWTAAKPVTIKVDDVQALLQRYRAGNKAFGDLVDTVVCDAYRAGACFLTVPTDFKDIKLPYMMEDRDRDTVKALTELAGSTVRIVDCNYLGKALCGASCPFPSDMAPLFIFDAAARVTAGYRERQARIGDTERLATIQSDYVNVKVRTWAQGASRSSLRKKAVRDRIVDGIVDTINASTERFLIVHPMRRDNEGYDLAAEFTKALDDPSRVSFIHWGDHHGTNDHREIRNVVLIGVWHKPTSAAVAEYMAMTGLAGDQIKEGDWDALRTGWLKENIMQAAGRANLRNVKDGVAGECNVYLITAAQDDPRGLVRDVFPGCVVEEWVPVEKPLTGHIARVVDYLVALRNNREAKVKKKAVYEALGLSKSQFSNLLKDFAEVFSDQKFESKGQTLTLS